MQDDNSSDIYPEIDPFVWFGSSFGNAYFSGLSYEQLWSAVQIAKSPEQLDSAISAIADLNQIVYSSPKGESNETSTTTKDSQQFLRK